MSVYDTARRLTIIGTSALVIGTYCDTAKAATVTINGSTQKTTFTRNPQNAENEQDFIIKNIPQGSTITWADFSFGNPPQNSMILFNGVDVSEATSVTGGGTLKFWGIPTTIDFFNSTVATGSFARTRSPEPSTILSLLTIGGIALASSKRKQS